MQFIYEAQCIEHGELFYTAFKTKETDSNKLMEIGSDLAMGWGGECYAVKKVKDQSKYSEVKDIDNDK